MAGSLILDDDLLVLQRKGDFDIKDAFYETKFPDQFPNIRIDTDIFHFTGADLRFSVNEYVEDSGRFVLTRGDKMTGNLTIDVGTGATEKTAAITLIGNRTGTTSYSRINFRNEARSSNRTLSIQAIAPLAASTETSHMKIADRVAITEHGQILMSGGRHNVCGLNGGALKAITNASWDTSNNVISDPLESNSTRLKWDLKGGSLVNDSNKDIVRWNDVGLYINGSSDALFKVIDTYARYNGDIINGLDITNKQYVDQQDGKSIPLKGTRATAGDLGYTLEQNVVDGPIDFTNDGTLNATVNNKLKLTRNNSIKLTIGGDSDDNVHLHNCDFNFHDKKLLNVPDPDTSDQTDPDAKNAVPKKYIDSEFQRLKDIVDNIADITAPPGMINAFTGTTAPTGWFLCNGGSYKCGEHPNMHKALGGTQAQINSNPNQTYSLPNLGGRFLAQYGKRMGTNQSPVGTNVRQYTNQKTSEPYSSGLGSNTNDNDYKYRMVVEFNGSHSHFINIEGLAITGGGAHMHRTNYIGFQNSGNDGKKHNYAAMKATNSPSSNKESGYFDWSNGGNHNHGIGFNKKANSDNYHTGYNLIYTEGNHRHFIPADQWDTYTLPYAYTINWIIKHDN